MEKRDTLQADPVTLYDLSFTHIPELLLWLWRGVQLLDHRPAPILHRSIVDPPKGPLPNQGGVPKVICRRFQLC